MLGDCSLCEIEHFTARATRRFLAEVRALAGLPEVEPADDGADRMTWYARSIDSNYLTNKRVFIFGDATHAIAAARIASEEMGFKVCGLGTYMREFARDVRAAAAEYGVEPLISDDHLEVERAIIEARPELVRIGVPYCTRMCMGTKPSRCKWSIAQCCVCVKVRRMPSSMAPS